MANAVLRLWQDGTVGAGMGREGRRRVEAKFDVRRMVAAYEAMYEQRDPA